MSTVFEQHLPSDEPVDSAASRPDETYPHVRLFTPHGDVDAVSYNGRSRRLGLERKSAGCGPDEVAAALPGLSLPIRIVPVRSGHDEAPNPAVLERDRRELEERLTAEFGADRLVRAAVYPSSRRWVMPAFGIQGELTPEEAASLDVAAVLADSGLAYDGDERDVRIRPVQETCSMSRVVGGGLCESLGGPYGNRAMQAHHAWQRKHELLAAYLGYSCGRT